MKFYKIQGESGWYSWEDLHNLYGYTEYPSLSLQYKSAASETWGEYAASGYSDNAFEDLAECSYFVSGEPGWGNLNDLATVLHLYPAVCADGPNVTNGEVTSPTATYDFNGETFYLIREDLAHGWIAGADLSTYGWEIEDQTQYELLFFDTTTGKVSYGVESLNELAFVEAGFFTIDGVDDVVFVEQSPYPIVSHSHVDFDTVQTLADGAHIDTILPYYTSKLYIAGTVDSVGETVVNFGLDVSNEGGYVRITNNTGASVTLTRLTIQSMDATDAEVVEVVDGQDNHAWAFKWDDGGIPYWWISYSGERNWTGTLGNWSEVPSVVLPTVTIYAGPSTLCAFRSDGNAQTINSGSSSNMTYYWTGNQFTAIRYDNSVLYGMIVYRSSGVVVGRSGLSFFKYNDPYSPSRYLGVTNVSGQSITVDRFDYATCSDPTATVVTVYDSYNNAYNAFKFTASGTDYYYVLDGTQNDWTDDLSSIGYSLSPVQNYIDVFFYLTPTKTQKKFSANDYWSSVVIDDSDKNTLENFGVQLQEFAAGEGYGAGYIISRAGNSGFTFEPIGLYYGVRTVDNEADMSNFYCDIHSGSSAGPYYGICIYSRNAYNIYSVTWKCRITKL